MGITTGYQYANRKGDIYHLQSHARPDGKLRYSFARKPSGLAAERLPEGYEAYEDPANATVVLRKIKPSTIYAAEMQLLEGIIKELLSDELCIVAIDGDSLVVYHADVRREWEMLRHLGEDERNLRRYMETMRAIAQFTKMLRFELMDAESRFFSAYRWCFRGSIDDWIILDNHKPLAVLARKYLAHLGKESFYDLLPYEGFSPH